MGGWPSSIMLMGAEHLTIGTVLGIAISIGINMGLVCGGRTFSFEGAHIRGFPPARLRRYVVASSCIALKTRKVRGFGWVAGWVALLSDPIHRLR